MLVLPQHALITLPTISTSILPAIPSNIITDLFNAFVATTLQINLFQ